MKIVIQRVSQASVSVDEIVISEIKQGYLILLGIEQNDNIDDAEWLVNKISNLRIFGDDNGVMNNSINDISGEVIVVSQFTLHAKTKKGNRPSYIHAAKPEISLPLFKKFTELLKSKINNNVYTGEFGAYMKVALINDGPVTIIIDTKNKE
ncbi:MAG: D-tyrosyl-tRNA(Tyr) deacylase [Bacteroidales bacterium]|nr:D-tyrosyl-tRNA(Tyr) deacylase [Bacteroidales bacterium]